jgi:hypothetical protein
MHAFDAYQALAAEAGNVLAAPQPPEAAEAEKKDSPTAAAAPPPVDTPAALSHVPVEADVKTVAVETRVPTSQAITAPAEGTGPTEETPLLTRLLREPTRAQMWTMATAALGLLLLVQALFAYRSDIAARSPAFRSVLTALCEHVGCRVRLPQRPDLVRIEASDVHMVDASRPQLIQLTATLRSYASYDLGYPALDLVLTNANEHALARRIFPPDEYLDQSRDPQAGIPANAEITVALDLDTGNLGAAGFRLDLLPAP